MIVLYVLFALSVLCPIYTYAIYPVILKFLPGKKYKTEEIRPYVTAIILGNSEDASKKASNLIESVYPVEKLEVLVASGNINDSISKAKGDIVLFTDTETFFDKHAIANLMKCFADEKVGCVVGQQRKRPDKDGKPTDSTLWKYENKVKEFESRIGCVSGANGSIYAVRKNLVPAIKPEIINKDFFVATSVTQSGMDVVFEPSATAYEEPAEGNNFEKHVRDGAGNYLVLGIFWRMLFPRKGWFVYVGHRVMKWLVPFNMIVAFVTSGILAFHIPFGVMAVLFGCQVMAYLILLITRNRAIGGAAGKLLSILQYFISLNCAYFVGLAKIVRRKS